jgi:hypothetical protein
VVDGLAGLGIFDAMGADHVHADSAGETKIEGAGGLILTPHSATSFLYYFLKFKRISMNRHFNISYSVAAGKVADGIAGEKQNHFGFAGCVAQVAQRALLVCRQPVFQKVDVIGH